MHAEADILRELVDIPQRQPEDVVPDAVLLERPQVILHDRYPAPDAIRRGPASAPKNNTLRTYPVPRRPHSGYPPKNTAPDTSASFL